jgi:hypothetical protein
MYDDAEPSTWMLVEPSTWMLGRRARHDGLLRWPPSHLAPDDAREWLRGYDYAQHEHIQAAQWRREHTTTPCPWEYA